MTTICFLNPFGTGDYDQHLALLKKAIELDKPAYGPTLVDAYVKVADQYNQAGRLDQTTMF